MENQNPAYEVPSSKYVQQDSKLEKITKEADVSFSEKMAAETPSQIMYYIDMGTTVSFAIMAIVFYIKNLDVPCAVATFASFLLGRRTVKNYYDGKCRRY
jgi:hypothetical protein